ncbi:MAG: hypothetical protein WC043_01000 [Pseudobdellovibrionaceae bacterium]
MDAFNPTIPTIDEQSYLGGCTLNEALFRYGSPEALQNYKLAIKPTKAPMDSAEDNKTLIGFLAVTTQTIQHFKNQQEITKNAIEALYREIKLFIKNGRLIPYSYQLPRKLSDLPIRIPIDIFLAGIINWDNSELIYKNFEFTGIRLIEPLRTIAKISIEPEPIIKQISFKEVPKEIPKEIPLKETIKTIASPSFADLDPELHIDEKRAAIYLGISPRTLQGYRVKGGGPEFLKISHKVVRYKVADLIKWAESRKKRNTSEK